MAKRPWAQTISRVRHIGLIKHAAQTETGSGQQGLVFAEAMLACQLVEHFAVKQAAVEQSGVKTRQAARIAVAIGRRLLHASPFRLVGTGEHRGRIGECTSGHGRGFTHGHLQQALGRGVADVALAPGDVRHAVKLFVSQTDMKIQAQWLGHAGHDRFPGPRPSARRNNSPISQP